MIKIDLPFKLKCPILACGADLKGAFALAKGDKAYLVDGFGDLSDLDNLTKYEKTIKEAAKKLKIKPRIVACDLHPGYFSTGFAEDYALFAKCYTLYKVQHHEAHIASAIVDNQLNSDVIGVAFDGTGFGLDGNIWGGEFFVGNLRNLIRAAHFDYIPMPGADMVVKEPWRMAVSYLYRIFGEKFIKLPVGIVRRVDKKKWCVLKKMIDKKINSPLTSSAGRLFDAAGSIILSKGRAKFEAEIPVALERMTADDCNNFYNFDIKTLGGKFIIDVSRTFKGIIKDLSDDIDKSVVAAKFHNTMAEIIVKTSLSLSKKFRIKKIVLSGGVFQNRYLIEKAVQGLEEYFEVYVNLNIPMNDLCIPLGQLAITDARAICA